MNPNGRIKSICSFSGNIQDAVCDTRRRLHTVYLSISVWHAYENGQINFHQIIISEEKKNSPPKKIDIND